MDSSTSVGPVRAVSQADTKARSAPVRSSAITSATVSGRSGWLCTSRRLVDGAAGAQPGRLRRPWHRHDGQVDRGDRGLHGGERIPGAQRDGIVRDAADHLLEVVVTGHRPSRHEPGLHRSGGRLGEGPTSRRQVNQDRRSIFKWCGAGGTSATLVP
ncbi:hypothetical protein AMK33_17800 [Streptomyces sp. CB02400]|nr:hypothetical protein AMK33_17800 [Streptomyces sp. CB02400]